MVEEFKKFIMRGNVVDMAVGIIMGTAFGAIVKSLVDDIVMPPVGLLLGNVDFASLSIVLREEPEVVSINYGLFINTILSFLIISGVMFFLIRTVNRLKRKKPAADPTTKPCPYCFTAIPIEAVRCPNCTSQLEGA